MTDGKDYFLGSEEIPAPQSENMTHPGSMLKEVYLDELGLTPEAFARHIGVESAVIAELCRESAPVTPELAMRLGRALGTGPQIWLNAQQNYEYARALRTLRASGAIKTIEAVPALL